VVIVNPYYSAEVHGPHDVVDIGDLVLEEGSTLRGCQLAYQTLGQLNAAKDNAVLVTTWYSGNHGIMRDTYVGPGRALDPDQWFVVLVNQIGSGLGTSPHNLEGPYGQGGFPRVRIGDDVVAQERLLREHLGVEELALVFGGSMGAQQTYEWAVRFPDRVKRAAPLAGTARSMQHCINWSQTLVETLEGDPAWSGGYYRTPEDVRAGLKRHAGLFALYVLSNRFWTEEHWRALGFSSPQDFRVGFLEGYFAPMDANALLWLAWKWQHGDVSRHTGGDLAAALGRITARTTVMPISTDLFFPVEDVAAEQALEGPGAAVDPRTPRRWTFTTTTCGDRNSRLLPGLRPARLPAGHRVGQRSGPLRPPADLAVRVGTGHSAPSPNALSTSRPAGRLTAPARAAPG
jgi:homoserine O-acetyltransferase